MRHYCRIKQRSLIGELGILINKISSKKIKWIYHIFKFTNAFKNNHLSDSYNNIYFKQYNIERYKMINYNNNNFLFGKAIQIIEAIIFSFFHKSIKISERMLTCKNISSKKDILNEENIKFLEKEILNIIDSIKANDNELLLFIKTFILDIICCLKMLNKCPLFGKELKLLNLFNKVKNSDILAYFKKYFEIRKELEDNYNHKCKINQMHIIKNKNLILLLAKYDIKIYDINDLNFNNCICSKGFQFNDGESIDINIVMISEEFFILRKAELSYISEQMADHYHYHYVYEEVEMFLLELQYNSSNKNVQLVIHNLKLNDTIYDLDAFNKNNIICIDNKYIYFYNLVNANINLVSKIVIIGNFEPYFIIADKLNQKIILLNSYEYNLLSYNINNKSFYNKKIKGNGIITNYIKDWSKLFKILNKDTYLLSIGKTRIYLISSNYLEIISEYVLKDKFDNCFILNSMNMIFLSYNNSIIIYRYENGELNFYKKKYCKYYEKMIDIKEINDKGDHILAIQKTICKYKINLSRLYYNKYNDNFDYPFLTDRNINGYKDELDEFYKHIYEPYDSEGSDNSDESDESDDFYEIKDFGGPEEYYESDDSNNKTLYTD